MTERPKKTKQKINESKSWFFKNINRIDEPIASLIRKQRGPVHQIRNENSNVTTDVTET